MDSLYSGIQYIKGIGPKKAICFEKLDIYRIIDLLYNFPRDYEDRSIFKKLSCVLNNEIVSLMVKVEGTPTFLRTQNKLKVYRIPISDDSGKGFAIFYNNPFITKVFKRNDSVYLHGKVKRNFGEIQVIQPTYEFVSQEEPVKFKGIIPVYNLTQGITQNDVVGIQRQVIENYLCRIEEYLPKETIERNGLISIQEALKNIHFPSSLKSLNSAKLRLIFEELLILQLGLLVLKDSINRNNKSISFEWKEEVHKFIGTLPYSLTKAQKKVIKEIKEDMEGPKQMYRLVQGDVGSGKTIVAFISLLNAVKNGYQGVFMAPTEILANQHFQSAKELLEPLNINIELLTGSLSKKNSMAIKEALKEGKVDIVIGTHALIQEGVEFKKLGIVITDEQHRFGVKQRETLSNKGISPDILVMTATPIPRTLALILYGDLDISTINELPEGRKPIKTYCINENKRKDAYKFIRNQIKEGRQAYIVAPLIEESETITAKSVEELYDELKNDLFKEFKVGLLHGKMPSIEKEGIIKNFYAGAIDILVSTTVIEVGVNVPNSSIMVIENSERFGLAQLHQLRGRVGRGSYQSYCIMIDYNNSKNSKERMKIMSTTNNGFIIAEKDLELRGPGDFFGTRQHGLPELKIANLFQNINELALAQKEAINLLKKYPMLDNENVSMLKNQINMKYQNSINL